MMAKISLRTYNQEIDNLIERGLIEEAIAHSRHILSIFPKHVDTYRLLGKAFLEGQRYGDAADILQRVLSSIPDDFVSHVGMSITREDEGNLDEAISHMERAFEIQPSNNAIQDELRRLYGRRDGFEPPKIRLTRGALARMYFKGELYQQAIAELRAGLVEDPSRLDLQTLLAQAYARSGQRAEAVDGCVALLKKLPYSLVANQIMSEILTASDREEDTQAYRLRLQELDPYYAQISPSASTPALVSDQAVTLEHLEYRPGMDSQPNWAASLGASLSSEPAEELPDWLAPDDTPAQSQTWESNAAMLYEDHQEPSGPVEAEDAAEDSEQEIPEWLREAGWGPSTGEFVEGPMALEDEEEPLEETDLSPVTPGDQASDDLAQADIPEWLKELAPEEHPGQTGDFSWIDNDKSNEMETESFWESGDEGETGPQPETAPEAASLSDEEIPDWLKDFSGETPSELAAQPTSEWQTELPEKTADEEMEQAPVEEAGLESLASSIPAWMQELDAERSEDSDHIEISGQVTGIEAGGFQASDAGFEDFQDSGLAETEAFSAMGFQSPNNESSDGDIDIPDWLRAEPDTESSSQAAGEEQEMDRTSQPISSSPEESSVEIPADSTDWNQETGSGDEQAFSDRDNWIEQPAGEEPSAESPQVEAIPELEKGEDDLWAESLKSQAAQIFDNKETEQEDLPEWLTEMESKAVEAGPVDPLADTKPSRVRDYEQAPEATEPEGAGEVLDWMLAETPSEDEQTLEGEIQPGELPDWLLAERDEADQNLIEASEEPGEAELEKAELPDWIKDLPGASSESEAEIWTEAGEVDPVELPVWMLEDQANPVEQVDEAEITEDEVAAEIAPEPEPEVSPQDQFIPEDIDLDAAFAWMEGLAARQGAEEALLLNPEDRLETPPDWVQAAATEAGLEGPVSAQSSGAVWIVDTPEAIEIQPVDLASPMAEGEPSADKEPAGAGEPTKAQQAEATAELSAGTQELTGAGQALIYATSEMEAESAPLTEAQEAEEEQGIELSGEDSDAAFAWLESLAARQGAEEALLLTPEERRETPPDWVQAAAAATEDQSSIHETAAEEPSQMETVEPLEQETVIESSDWLVENVAETRPIEAQEAAALAESTFPDLFEEEFETETGQDESLVSIEPEALANEEVAPDEPVESSRMPDWLKEMVEPEKPSVTPPTAEAPPMPEDLRAEFETDEQAAAADRAVEVGQAAEQEEQEPVAEQPAIPADSETVPALPDWLADDDSGDSETLEWTPPVAEQPVRRYDLNQASLGELERLPGVGFIMAQSIIRYREANGPFEKVEDLLLVPGLSPTTMEFVQDQVFVSVPARVEPVQPVPAAEVQRSEAAEETSAPQHSEAPEEFLPARQALDSGDTDTAADIYTSLIKGKQNLPMIIEDLQQAVQRRPQELLLWQALGDALLRADRVEEALEAYDRAEELLH